MTYKAPNHTQTPNELIDKHMKDMGEAELKIVLATCRKTFGWHKRRDLISLTQYQEITGMSRQGCIGGIQKAIGRGVLERFPEQNGQGFEYGLVVNEDDQPAPKLVNEVDTQKKVILKKNTERDRFTDMLKKGNGLEGYPEYAVDFLRPFVEVFGRSPTTKDKSGWIKEAKNWAEMGVRPEDVKRMYNHAKEQGLAVKSPYSITFAFDALRNTEEVYYRKGK